MLEENRNYSVSASISDSTERNPDGTYISLGFVVMRLEDGLFSPQVQDLSEQLDYEQLDFSSNQLTFRLSNLSEQDLRLYVGGGTSFGDGDIPHHRISVVGGSPSVVWDVQEEDAYAFFCCLAN